MTAYQKGLIEWGLVLCACALLIGGGFYGGSKLSKNSWINLDLPACKPVEVEKVVNKGGACDMSNMDFGTLIEYKNKIYAVTDFNYYRWSNSPYELRISLTERKLK
jgi:hypothetical protein